MRGGAAFIGLICFCAWIMWLTTGCETIRTPRVDCGPTMWYHPPVVPVPDLDGGH